MRETRRHLTRDAGDEKEPATHRAGRKVFQAEGTARLSVWLEDTRLGGQWEETVGRGS